MKYILSILCLLSITCFSQQTTTVKVPPSKDTTVVNFTTTTTTTSNTQTGYTTTSIPVKDSVVIPPPVYTAGIEGFGKTIGGDNLAPTNVSTASDIMNKARSNTNIVVTKGGTYKIRMNFGNTINLTIDGSKADGPVIFDNTGLGGDCVSFEGAGNHDIIVRGVAIRNAGNDCGAVNSGAYKIVFDHCSFSNAGDGSIDLTNSPNITVQWCIIGNSVAGASLVDYPGAKNISVHHNLFIGSFERNPLIGSQQQSGRTDLVCDFVNNIVWKWQNYGTDVNNNGTANVQNNYYYSTSNPDRAVLTAKNSYGTYPQGFAYVNGNFSGNGTLTDQQSNHAYWPVPAEFKITMQSACDAAKLVLANVGPPKKDQKDLDLIKQVTLIGCPAQ